MKLLNKSIILPTIILTFCIGYYCGTTSSWYICYTKDQRDAIIHSYEKGWIDGSKKDSTTRMYKMSFNKFNTKNM